MLLQNPVSCSVPFRQPCPGSERPIFNLLLSDSSISYTRSHHGLQSGLDSVRAVGRRGRGAQVAPRLAPLPKRNPKLLLWDEALLEAEESLLGCCGSSSLHVGLDRWLDGRMALRLGVTTLVRQGRNSKSSSSERPSRRGLIGLLWAALPGLQHAAMGAHICGRAVRPGARAAVELLSPRVTTEPWGFKAAVPLSAPVEGGEPRQDHGKLLSATAPPNLQRSSLPWSHPPALKKRKWLLEMDTHNATWH